MPAKGVQEKVKERLATAVLLLLLAGCARSVADEPLLTPAPPRSASPSPAASPVVQMPDVLGMAYADAKGALTGRGFTVKRRNQYSASARPERVLKQSRKAGSIVDVGTTITLTVAIPIPPAVNGNPWGYNWGCCKSIKDPPSDFCSFFACVLTFHNGTGFVVQCEDGLFSLTGGTGRQTCISHNGYKRTLYAP